MILINQTFQTVTPESAVNGDYADSGFVLTNEPVTFRDLVSLMSDHPESSCCPRDGSIWEWYSTYGEINYRTGEERTTSIHYSRQNPPRNEKYWRKAALYVEHKNRERRAGASVVI
jgi:hypothetical protein